MTVTLANLSRIEETLVLPILIYQAFRTFSSNVSMDTQLQTLQHYLLLCNRNSFSSQYDDVDNLITRRHTLR